MPVPFTLRAVLCVAAAIPAAAGLLAAEPLDIGSRRELFVDDYLIDKLAGGARLHLHRPRPGEVVLVADKPWEGNTCAYFTIFQDDDIFRMYYRGSHWDEKAGRAAHREVVCYAESDDGIHWTKPELGLFEFDGSKQNNIVWDGVGGHNFTPFRDARPNVEPAARYKALARGSGDYPKGLYAFRSADAIRWELMSDKPVITTGAFDSQNLAFWDAAAGIYRDYHRGFKEGVRDIMTCTSKDFLTWSEPEYLDYSGAPREHLYTNAVRPYVRAEHILIGFPTRFLPKTQQVEPTFMTSRDGRRFLRYAEALIPTTAPEDRDGNRSNYMAWGVVQVPGEQRELSVYATEAYYSGAAGRLRRFTYRVDGFVSLRMGTEGGEMLTRPIVFRGDKLFLNYKAERGGAVAVELLDEKERPIGGLSLADCVPLAGDDTDAAVEWKGKGDLKELAGRPVRLRIEAAGADVFAIRFGDP